MESNLVQSVRSTFTLELGNDTFILAGSGGYRLSGGMAGGRKALAGSIMQDIASQGMWAGPSIHEEKRIARTECVRVWAELLMDHVDGESLLEEMALIRQERSADAISADAA